MDRIATTPPDSPGPARGPGGPRRHGARTLAAALVFAPVSGHAADWIVTVGGGAGLSPPYEGAGRDVVTPLLGFNLRRASVPYRFTPPDGGSTIAVVNTRHFVFGPVARFRRARGDNGPLQGMDKIGAAVEPGAFAEVWPTDWLRLRAEARYGLASYNGPVGDAAIDLIHTGRLWNMSIGPRYGYGGTRYMDTYFGVTPVEAARSPLIKAAYEPGQGERYVGLQAAVSHNWTHRIRTTVAFGYHRLSRLAQDSPVVQVAGSPNDYSAGVTMSYSFGWRIGR